MTIRNAGRGTPSYNEGAIFKGKIRGIEETVRVEGDLAISGSQSKYILPLNDGQEDQIISTDGSGTLDWIDRPTFKSVNPVIAGLHVDKEFTAEGWEFIPCDAYNRDVIIHLPLASQSKDVQICVKSIGPMNGNEIRVVTYLSMGSVDGSPYYTMTGDRECITIISDGNGWHIISKV